MRNKANFKKSQMFTTLLKTMDYNEKLIMDSWSKQTQTKPTCGELVEPIRCVSVVILEIQVHIPSIRQTFLFGQLDLGTLQICPAKLKRREEFSKFCYVNLH
jgi:hypothetical protein